MFIVYLVISIIKNSNPLKVLHRLKMKKINNILIEDS